MIAPAGKIADVAAVAAHYDDLDELYRGLWGTSLHHGYWITGIESSAQAVANLTRLVAERAALKPGDRVCDFGCGYGAAALLWQREYGARVTGITVSEKQYCHAQAAARGKRGVDFILGDVLANGLPAQSFDAVTAIESSEHVANKPKFFAEAHRLLRPGGRCAVAAWLVAERPGGWSVKHLLEPICIEGRLPNLASAREYCAMLADAGFHEIVFFDLTVAVRKTWAICARRVAGHFFTDAAFRRRLADRRFSNRVFAKTVFRLWLAYRTRGMRYGLFTGRK